MTKTTAAIVPLPLPVVMSAEDPADLAVLVVVPVMDAPNVRGLIFALVPHSGRAAGCCGSCVGSECCDGVVIVI